MPADPFDFDQADDRPRPAGRRRDRDDSPPHPNWPTEVRVLVWVLLAAAAITAVAVPVSCYRQREAAFWQRQETLLIEMIEDNNKYAVPGGHWTRQQYERNVDSLKYVQGKILSYGVEPKNIPTYRSP